MGHSGPWRASGRPRTPYHRTALASTGTRPQRRTRHICLGEEARGTDAARLLAPRNDMYLPHWGTEGAEPVTRTLSLTAGDAPGLQVASGIFPHGIITGGHPRRGRVGHLLHEPACLQAEVGQERSHDQDCEPGPV